MKQTKWYIHPIFIFFVLSTSALAISLFLYIYWYVGVSAGLTSVASRYHLDPDQFIRANTWVVILVLSLLFGVISRSIRRSPPSIASIAFTSVPLIVRSPGA